MTEYTSSADYAAEGETIQQMLSIEHQRPWLQSTYEDHSK